MQPLRIAVLGGTGPHGKGLGLRLARAGHRVRLGSRDASRAAATATELHELLGPSAQEHIQGMDNQSAVTDSDVVLVTVPYEGQSELIASLTGLGGLIVVSCVNPLGFDKVGPYSLAVPAGSAAEETAVLLPDSRVVAAFHHLSAPDLLRETDHDESVLVCGDDPDARRAVRNLARDVTGRDGVDAGPLRHARHLEGLTAVLIQVNRAYKTRSSVVITGIEHP